jgi:hypothetical protein
MTTTTIMVRESERNWLERLKRKHRLKSLEEVVAKIRSLFKKLKLDDELN